ncbi:hypothetical protein CMUS01_06616 [Colletotrichum musicola]|uniref:Uncharacterized protein n=1 Tax=Colletotrichum musicola TaxID=2175873 RepID=A0A8H6KKX8_9PEZI|nr:hypothetical protein CMUS01_06616 [Colletotrichum musicola]
MAKTPGKGAGSHVAPQTNTMSLKFCDHKSVCGQMLKGPTENRERKNELGMKPRLERNSHEAGRAWSSSWLPLAEAALEPHRWAGRIATPAALDTIGLLPTHGRNGFQVDSMRRQRRAHAGRKPADVCLHL